MGYAVRASAALLSGHHAAAMSLLGGVRPNLSRVALPGQGACEIKGGGRSVSVQQAQQLRDRQRHHAEHQMTQHLGMAAHAHVATAEFLLETTALALHG